MVGVTVFVVAVATFAVRHCKDPRRGQSRGNEAPVRDGSIVLLKRGNEVAAFVLQHQRLGSDPRGGATTERTDFSWYYRSDGTGTFRLGDPAVLSGFVSNATRVAFCSFAVAWSVHSNHAGWVYFSTGPLDVGKSADYRMYVTTETNLATIDANGVAWVYRVRPRVNLRAVVKSQTRK